MSSRLEWYADKVISKIEAATMAAIDSITTDTTIEAKKLVNVDTSALQGSIRPIRSEKIRDKITGFVGSWNIKYAIFQEFKIFKGAKPYLRPAADKFFVKLASRIKKFMES